MWEMHDGWGWWMMFGWIWMVLFWGAVVAAVIWVANRVGSAGSRRDPLEIAKERLARGDVSLEEFERLKGHLS